MCLFDRRGRERALLLLLGKEVVAGCSCRREEGFCSCLVLSLVVGRGRGTTRVGEDGRALVGRRAALRFFLFLSFSSGFYGRVTVRCRKRFSSHGHLSGLFFFYWQGFQKHCCGGWTMLDISKVSFLSFLRAVGIASGLLSFCLCAWERCMRSEFNYSKFYEGV